MSAASQLSARSKIEAREPLSSLVLRLSELSGFREPAELLRMAGLGLGFMTVPCDLSRLAHLTGNHAADLEEAVYWHRNSRRQPTMLARLTPTPYVSLHHPKICPSCVSEIGICDGLWDLSFYTLCPIHRLPLVYYCETCGDGLRWKRRGLLTCRCKGIIKHFGRPTLAGTIARYEISDVIGLLTQSTDLSELFKRYDALAPISSLSDFLRLVGFFVAAVDGLQRHTGLPSRRIEDLVPKLNQVHEIVFRWPVGFHRWIDSSFDRRSGCSSFGLLERFGKFPDRLRSTFQPRPSLRFVLTSFSEYLATSPRQLFPVKSHSIFSTNASAQRQDAIFANEAAKLLHVRPSRVSDLIRSHALAGCITRIGSRHTCVTSREALASYVERQAERLTEPEAAKILGVSSLSVEKIRRANLLRGAEKCNGRYHFSKSEIDAFAGRLRSACEVAGQSKTGYMPISELVGKKISTLVYTVKMVLSGELKGHMNADWRQDDTPLFDQIYVDQHQIIGRTRAENGDNGLAVKFAAKRLGLNSRMILPLLRAGCIARTPAAMNKPLAKCGLSESSVEAFKSKYCLSVEISAILGTSTGQIVKIARERGIRPIVQSEFQHGVSAVWSRADLTRFLD